MKTLGIIVEYNPLHNGHVHHWTASKATARADRTIAVISGPFLQRGEPAIVDKWSRTEMALAMGADLVIELPVAYAVQAAEWFAYGAVALLNATGIVDALCFGSESGDLAPLRALARVLAAEPAELKAGIATRLAGGASYPAAYAGAAAALAGGEADGAELSALLQQPNNTLGLHYLIALERLHSAITPFTIARTGAGYHDTLATGSIASATAVRRLLLAGGPEAAAPYVPSAVLDILRREWAEGRAPQTWEAFSRPLLNALITRSADELARMHEVTEGLEYRLKKLLPALPQPSATALLTALKTKRYTHVKLQRMLTHILLNHAKSDLGPARLAEGPAYIRVLGFNRTGQTMLAEMKKTASLPVITRPAALDHPHLQMDVSAAAVYTAGMPTAAVRSLYEDYFRAPVIVP
ncbi:nucleotidyltransferase [Paenibacillus sp. P96]|uniref:tRNA(Met) cytidine acetate ligase n=1 Tax=Paenibacillus zeirhizosphaerae TaxID=2987519 RepID=A0ABT9FSZ2_9BACL|nr:nucleotidyltransferase [Paenibacillus sp. P96]MDP4097587.1 nucleotidyltransferase [Paenibacillus sp. P96]